METSEENLSQAANCTGPLVVVEPNRKYSTYTEQLSASHAMIKENDRDVGTPGGSTLKTTNITCTMAVVLVGLVLTDLNYILREE